MHRLKRTVTFDNHLKTAPYYSHLCMFLFSFVISYAKDGETALAIAQRKRYCDVVSYLSKPLTAKTSIEGESIFSPLKGQIS